MRKKSTQRDISAGFTCRVREKRDSIVLVVLVYALTVNGAAVAAKDLEFDCPRAYRGIKAEMLPTYWEPTDKGERLGAGQSHVQGKYMICIYRKPNGKKIGNVRRLIPSGYHCITDGQGSFQCQRKNAR
jgi:hypothetical protein